jgi:serine/threonine protein kinase
MTLTTRRNFSALDSCLRKWRVTTSLSEPPGGFGYFAIISTRHFLKQLSSALKFLRDRNLIHRDIKPQNLLLCPSPMRFRSRRNFSALDSCLRKWRVTTSLSEPPGGFGFVTETSFIEISNHRTSCCVPRLRHIEVDMLR